MAESKVDVSSTGTLAVDYFALLQEIPGPDEKVMAKGYEIHPGGVAGNVITQVARLGISTGWFGKIGDDEAGKIIIREFINEGIDTAHVEIIKAEHSMFTWIQVDKNGDKSIIMFPNVLNKFTVADVEKKHKEYISSSKVLQVEACVLPLKPALRAMEIAKESGVQVVFDLDVVPSYFVHEAHLATEEELRRAIELADVFIPCKAAAAELIESRDIPGNARKLLDYGPRIVAVTLGDKGSIVLSRDEFHTIPSFKVKVMDTTGAGDAFHGGFIYGLIKELSLKNTGVFANACGAICCMNVGARAMGGLAEIDKLIRSSNVYDNAV
jgi:sugar/nucleoside kinase (ribokinase family)